MILVVQNSARKGIVRGIEHPSVQSRLHPPPHVGAVQRILLDLGVSQACSRGGGECWSRLSPHRCGASVTEAKVGVVQRVLLDLGVGQA